MAGISSVLPHFHLEEILVEKCGHDWQMSAWILERIWGVLHQLQYEEHDWWTNVCGCALKRV